MISDYNGLDIQIHILLKKIGMPAHIKGYKFVKEILIKILEKNDILDWNITNLYKTIGKKFNVKSTTIERNIRYAIGLSMSRCDHNIWSRYFGTAVWYKEYPTNSEFIASICDYLKIYHKELFNENNTQKIF